MLLALDVGNTDTVIGIFRGSSLVFEGRGPTSEINAYILKHQAFLKKCHSAIISSVVPSKDAKLRNLFKQKLNIKNLLFVTHTLKMPIKLKIDRPKEMGADRIVNNVAAYQKYKTDLLVIDFGTATTIDYIDKRGNYMGGVIIPGLKTAADALIQKAAKLNRVSLQRPRKVLGKNTLRQLQSGILIGHVAMVDRMIEKIQKEIGKKTKIIATGGLCRLLSPLSPYLKIIDPHLTLKGLRDLCQWNR